MRLILFVVFLLLSGCIVSGCAIYQAQTIDEYVALTKATDGNGCIYIRGNSRPYADVSILSIVAWGKNAPKYDECLKAVPENARSLAP
jgi:hypothetical protein